MKKNKLLFAALIALVTAGFVLVSCGDGAYSPATTSGGGNEKLDRLSDDANLDEVKAVVAKIGELVAATGDTEAITLFAEMSTYVNTLTEATFIGTTKTQTISGINQTIDFINQYGIEAFIEKIKNDADD